MDCSWQWAWDQYGARYSWVMCAITFSVMLPQYLLMAFVVPFERSGRYVEAAAVTVAAALIGPPQ